MILFGCRHGHHPPFNPLAPQATLIEVRIGLIHRQDETPVPTTRKGRPRASGNRPTGLRSGGYLTNRRIHAYHRCCAGEGRGGGGSGCPKPQPSPPGRVGSSDPCTWLPYRHRRRPPPSRHPAAPFEVTAQTRVDQDGIVGLLGLSRNPCVRGGTPSGTSSACNWADPRGDHQSSLRSWSPFGRTRGSRHRQTLKSDLFCRPQEVAHA